MKAKKVRSEASEDYVQVNKRHWNELAKRNQAKRTDMLKEIGDGTSYVEKWEPKLSPYLKRIKGKKIIVPQFGDGMLLLACAKKGAVVTGVDLSSGQVRLAREAATQSGLNVKLVEADWQNLPKTIPANHFDLAVTECGIFIWIKNLCAWMQKRIQSIKKWRKADCFGFSPYFDDCGGERWGSHN